MSSAKIRNAASIDKLGELHALLTKTHIARLQQDLEDGVFTDAATLSAVAKFLADNGVQHVVFDHMGQPMQHVVSKMGIGLHQAGSLQAREAARQAAVALG